MGITQIKWASLPGCVFHEKQKPINQIIHVTETSGLATIAINGDVFARQRLNDEIADDTAIIRVHPRSVGVEDTRHPDIQIVLPFIVKEQSFSGSFPFIIATADADRIHIAKIALIGGIM